MKDIEKEYLNELVRLDISQEDADKVRKILTEVGDVSDTLANPLVTYDEKRNIIKKLFPESMHKFIMSAIRDGQIENLCELLGQYDDHLMKRQ